MLFFPFQAAAGDPTPKTFEQLELAKINAVHDIHNFHEVVDSNVVSYDGTFTMHVDLLRDGARYRARLEVGGSQPKAVSTVSDGVNDWAWDDIQKTYSASKTPPAEKFDAHKDLLTTGPDSFNYRFNSDAQFEFACDPPFTLKSIEKVQEDGATYQKVVASVTKKSGNTMTLTQWFLPDKWILKKFTIEGHTQDGAFTVNGLATTLDLQAQVSPQDFKVSDNVHKGYIVVSAADGQPTLDDLKRAAEAGNSTAMYDLAQMYFSGAGVAKDPAIALSWLQKGAEAGNLQAMVYLAQAYAQGVGLKEDDAQALKWVQRAADLGDTSAMVLLAQFYFAGKAVPKDPAQCAVWAKKAADGGNAQGMDQLGDLYVEGLGVKQDYVAAADLYKKAAAAGSVTAYYKIGFLFVNGYGVDKDEAAGVKWFQKGADAGDPTAMVGVAIAYETGHGVDADRDVAISWYKKAAKLGSQDAVSALKRLGVDNS